MPGGFHQKARELNCSFQQLKNRVKHFRDTVTKLHRRLPSGFGDKWMMTARDIFILENFGFLREAVHIRLGATMTPSPIMTPPLSPFLSEESVKDQAGLKTALYTAASAPRPQWKRDDFITGLQRNILQIHMSVWDDFQQETMQLVSRYKGIHVSNLLLSYYVSAIY
jgi:hypothetical protein